MNRAVPLVFAGFLVFLVALLHDQIGFKFFTMAALSVVGFAILLLPINWSVRLLMFYLGFEGLAKVVSNYNPVIHVGVDLLIVAMVSKVLVLMVLGRIKQTESLPPMSPIFIAHFAWFVISIANPYAINIVASIAGAKVYVTGFLLFFFGYYLAKNRKEIKVAMGIWIFVVTIHCITGLIQAKYGVASLIAIHPRYAYQWRNFAAEGRAFRPFGLTNQPGAPSIYIFLSMSFLYYFIIATKKKYLKLALLALIPLFITMLFLCQVRQQLLKTILLSIAFGGAYLVTRKVQISPRALMSGLASLGVIAGIILLTPDLLEVVVNIFPDAERAIERTESLFDYERISQARHSPWGRLMKYLVAFPFGAGLSRTGSAAGVFSKYITEDDPFGKGFFFSDNFWIAVAIDLGFPGVILLTGLIGWIFFRGIKYLKQYYDRDDQLLHIAIYAGLFGSGLGMYGAEAMLYNPEQIYFWFFAGCVTRLQVDVDIEKRLRWLKWQQQNIRD